MSGGPDKPEVIGQLHSLTEASINHSASALYITMSRRVIHSGGTNPVCGAVPPGLIDLFWCAGIRGTRHVQDATADECDFPIHPMPDNMAVQPLREPRQIRAVLGVKQIRIVIASQIAVDTGHLDGRVITAPIDRRLREVVGPDAVAEEGAAFAR